MHISAAEIRSISDYVTSALTADQLRKMKFSEILTISNEMAWNYARVNNADYRTCQTLIYAQVQDMHWQAAIGYKLVREAE